MERFHCAVTDIAEGPLDPAAAIAFVSDPGFGGMTMFAGRVRDLNHGRVVTGVSYDMFEPLALNGFRAICEDMDTRFGPKVKLDWPGIVNLRLDPFEKMSIGDSLYADADRQKQADRLLLHAELLTFPHPQSGDPLAFACPPPF